MPKGALNFWIKIPSYVRNEPACHVEKGDLMDIIFTRKKREKC